MLRRTGDSQVVLVARKPVDGVASANHALITRILGRFIRVHVSSNWAISDLLTADDGVICEVQVVGPGAIEVDPTLDYFA
jgi:hypothetical protein